MKFVGGAEQTYNSFMDLARSMLDAHCHNWNNSLDPRSYILPPVCSFKNADKSDEDIEKIKVKMEQKKQDSSSAKSLNHNQKVVERQSDSAEFVVFHALWALAQDNVAAPFLAIHGLNLDKVRCYFQQIFPLAKVDIEKEFDAMMREYDFVLIGPKIGLIVIEVKSTQFTKAQDFAENNKHLPYHIRYALKDQLGSFDPTIFQVCSESDTAPTIPIRKILFTPNLEKRRFETWINKLDDATKEVVKAKYNGATHWFSEDMGKEDIRDKDMVNKINQKPPLYSSFRQEMEKEGYEISQEIFESYGLIISGFRSAVVLQSQATISSEQLSTSNAILKDAATLESQCQKSKLLNKNATNVVEAESKLVLLTPEQQEVMNGPNRQFIIGAPGTGKTIIFQAKIPQLLKDGKKVLIFAQSGYARKYKTLFGSHGSCMVRVIDRLSSYFPQLTAEFLKKRISEDGTIRETLEKLSVFFSYSSLLQVDFTEFDCIFFDDAFDSFGLGYFDPQRKRKFIFELILLMTITSNSKLRSKFIWVACDAYLNDFDEEANKRILNQIIRGEQGDYFSTAILNRVMRSSESVFQALYSTEVTQHLEIKPSIGHKIHGFYDSVHLGNLSPSDACLEIWKHTYSAVKKFKEDGIGYGHMAVLVGGEHSTCFKLVPYLLNKFRENDIPVEHIDKDWDLPGFLTLASSGYVSSFEWPVVIYIGMFEEHEKRVSTAYYRYRACSRATMKLFEIVAIVEIDLEAVDFYRGDDGLYVLLFHNRAQNQINISSRDAELIASEHGGKLFKSIVGWYVTVYKIDLKEIRGVCKDFLNLLSPTDRLEQKHLEARRKEVPLTLDGLEYYCRRGHRLDLVEFLVNAKKTK